MPSLKKQIKKKVRFEIWFLMTLLVIAVITFAVAYRVLSPFFRPGEPIAVSFFEGETGLYPSSGDGDSELSRFLSFLTEPKRVSYLTGEEADTRSRAGTIMAVVVENHEEARRELSGLEAADLVYETVAEGGITRFLALYTRTDVDWIGPVRSARPYFVDWAEEYGGSLTHVGGSPEALNRLQNGSPVLNIEERLDHDVIRRDPNLPAPHNAFASTARIANWMLATGYHRPPGTPRFRFERSETRGQTRVVTIRFGSPLYDVKYAYNPETNRYERHLRGERNGEIAPANLIVQVTDQEVIDRLLRLRIRTTGTGRALVFRNGEVIEGSWQKEEGGLTQFFDASGEPVTLTPGQTWITVVSPAMGVDYF